MEWKTEYAEMQVGFKILLDVLERLIREDTKIYPRGSGKQGEKDRVAKKTVAEGKTFFIKLGLTKFTMSCQWY